MVGDSVCTIKNAVCDGVVVLVMRAATPVVWSPPPGAAATGVRDGVIVGVRVGVSVGRGVIVGVGVIVLVGTEITVGGMGVRGESDAGGATTRATMRTVTNRTMPESAKKIIVTVLYNCRPMISPFCESG
jgi:hypothetical protein